MARTSRMARSHGGFRGVGLARGGDPAHSASAESGTCQRGARDAGSDTRPYRAFQTGAPRPRVADSRPIRYGQQTGCTRRPTRTRRATPGSPSSRPRPRPPRAPSVLGLVPIPVGDHRLGIRPAHEQVDHVADEVGLTVVSGVADAVEKGHPLGVGWAAGDTPMAPLFLSTLAMRRPLPGVPRFGAESESANQMQR